MSFREHIKATNALQSAMLEAGLVGFDRENLMLTMKYNDKEYFVSVLLEEL